MNLRGIVGIICLLFLSASTIFSSVHQHNGDSNDGDVQCAACAWHAQAKMDIPADVCAIAPPDQVITRFDIPAAFLASEPIFGHFGRGPPLLS